MSPVACPQCGGEELELVEVQDSLADWARDGLGGELTRCQTCAP